MYNDELRLARSGGGEAEGTVSKIKGKPVDIFIAIGGAPITEAKGDVVEESIASAG